MKDFFTKIKSFFLNLFRRDIYKHIRPCGVCEWQHTSYLVGFHKKTGNLIFLPHTKNGFSYRQRKQGLLVTKNGRPVQAQKELVQTAFSLVGKNLFMLYTTKKDGQQKIHIAASSDGVHFKKRAVVVGTNPVGITEIDDQKKKTLVLFYGDEQVHTYISTNHGNAWKPYADSILAPDNLHAEKPTPLAISRYKNHLYLLYKDANNIHDALIDNPNISHTIWNADEPVWKHEKHTPRVLGTICGAQHATLYVIYPHIYGIQEIILPYPLIRSTAESPEFVRKHPENPVLTPDTQSNWESMGAFNPAAVTDDTGTVHILYRAVGDDGVSRLGYASSADGYSFTNRDIYPAYVHNSASHSGPKRYSLTIYPSGGSWGGSEDPRLTRIGDRIYMTYTAFSGWNSIRIALTSISVTDFVNKRWDRWNKPLLISPPEETHKNWVLFPEKIHGKYAILHGIVPNIMIEYVDDIHNISDYIKSERPQGPQAGRETAWDNVLRGAGPPPLKTPRGWLLFYHAMSKKEFHKYKVGAMLLDLKDPTKILHRSHKPVISPDLTYENEGKPGIVYASGAVIKDDTLFIYYGGGDRVSCVASTPLDAFLDALIKGNSYAGMLRTTKIQS